VLLFWFFRLNGQKIDFSDPVLILKWRVHSYNAVPNYRFVLWLVFCGRQESCSANRRGTHTLHGFGVSDRIFNPPLEAQTQITITLAELLINKWRCMKSNVVAFLGFSFIIIAVAAGLIIVRSAMAQVDASSTSTDNPLPPRA
jgi:hypothetical protein